MTQVVLVRQIASQPWCLLLWRNSNESKARPRQCNCSARPGAVAREDTTCYRDAPCATRCGSLPTKQGSVERRRGDLSQIRQGRRRRKNTAVPAAAPKANKK